MTKIDLFPSDTLSCMYEVKLAFVSDRKHEQRVSVTQQSTFFLTVSLTENAQKWTVQLTHGHVKCTQYMDTQTHSTEQ